MRGWILVLALGLAACGASGRTASEPRLVLSKCSACHLTPEPGTLDPATFVRVHQSHASRIPLTPAQWQEIERDLLHHP